MRASLYRVHEKSCVMAALSLLFVAAQASPSDCRPDAFPRNPVETSVRAAMQNAAWLDRRDVQQARMLSTGKGVTVAVIDTGVDFGHWQLEKGLRIDGYNFGDNNRDIHDDIGHGTLVAGIIAGQKWGLAPDATILPIKVNASGSLSFKPEALASGIDYAVEHGAQIINLSLYANEKDRSVADAIRRALAKGVIIVAAAGNQGGNVSFPGSLPGTIVVAGTNVDGTLSPASNRGDEITIAAPSRMVGSTLSSDDFNPYAHGTSFAAPIVSAAIAALLQINPQLDREQVIDTLRSTADGIPNTEFDFGQIDVGRALQAAKALLNRACRDRNFPVRNTR